MASLVILPKMGQSVESCIITEWFKSVGDDVAVGDALYEMETDKSAFTENAEVAGKLLAIIHGEGDDVPCLEAVAIIGEEGEDISALLPKADAAPAAEAPKAEEPAPVAEPDTAVEGRMGGAVSPRARAMAERMHLDCSLIPGTGPNGRVIERDVLNYKGSGSAIGGRWTEAELAAASAPEAEYEDVKHSNTRKVIARSMMNSLSTMAQLTHSTSFDATQLNAFRAALKKAAEKGAPKVTVNDIILYAVARVLPQFKELNAHYYDDKLRCFKSVNLGIATDTPRGLLVPTLFGADKLDIFELATESKKIIGAAREGKISPDLLKGASFTVSNLGSMGIESFTPIVNPPQTGILGVCSITDRVRMSANSISVYPAMGLSLTYDHRAMDGAPASRFLVALVEALTNIIDFYKEQGDHKYELEL